MIIFSETAPACPTTNDINVQALILFGRLKKVTALLKGTPPTRSPTIVSFWDLFSESTPYAGGF